MGWEKEASLLSLSQYMQSAEGLIFASLIVAGHTLRLLSATHYSVVGPYSQTRQYSCMHLTDTSNRGEHAGDSY